VSLALAYRRIVRRLPGFEVGLHPQQVVVHLVLRVDAEHPGDPVPERTADRMVDELHVGRRRAVAVVPERDLPRMAERRAVLRAPRETTVLFPLGHDGVERELEASGRANRPAPPIVTALAAVQPLHLRDVLRDRRQPFEVAPDAIYRLDGRLYPDALVHVDRVVVLADTEHSAQLAGRQRAAEQHGSGAADGRAGRPVLTEAP